MALVLTFLLLLILMFGVLVYLLKPTAMERAVEDQLASIEGGQSSRGTRTTTILKDKAVGSNALDELARCFRGPSRGHASSSKRGSTWSFGSVSTFSVIAGVAMYGLASLFNASFLFSLILAVAVGFCSVHLSLHC
jgi:hypothetical protein